MAGLTGYGSELWADERGIRTDRLVRGSLLPMQALRRRITTEPNELQGVDDTDESEAEYGFNLPGLLGAIGYDAALRAIPALVQAEAMKDDRIASVEASATVVDLGAGFRELRVSLDVTLRDSGEVFPLTLAVSDARATIVQA